MNFTSDVLPWITQGIMGAVLLYLAFKKAPVERMTLDATTANQYAQAAKAKGEENSQLMVHIAQLETRLDAVENKRYKISIEFLTGDPPEVLKAEVAQILIPVMPKLKPVPKPKKAI